MSNDNLIVAHEPTHATTKIAGKICTAARGYQGVFLKRKTPSFHLPPMNLQTLNVFFDRSSQGSGIGAHCINLVVGLLDHSDPRMLHAPESKDHAHMSAALKPSVDHFSSWQVGLTLVMYL
jgi:hypothetical protein